MGMDFAMYAYLPCFDTFARTVTCYPAASQPGASSFPSRGIFDTNETDVVAMDGSILTDTRTELDIFMPEWPTLPVQGDVFYIPWEDDVDGGNFVVADVHGQRGNAGGELTLILTRMLPTLVPGYLIEVDALAVGDLDFAMPMMTINPTTTLPVLPYGLASPDFALPVLS